MVGQHDAAGAHANAAGAARDMRDQDGRRGTRNARHAMVLGQPVTVVTPALRMLGQIKRMAKRLCRVAALHNRAEIEY